MKIGSKGKRGGARVIPFIKYVAETVYLVAIDDKSEKSDIKDDVLIELLEELTEVKMR